MKQQIAVLTFSGEVKFFDADKAEWNIQSPNGMAVSHLLVISKGEKVLAQFTHSAVQGWWFQPEPESAAVN